MALMKEMQFPVGVRWRGGRLARVDAREKDPIEVTTPPEFRTGTRGYWTPEEMLVASAASSFVLTLAALAERRGIALLDATVIARGHVGHRNDGTFGFTLVEVDAQLETVAGSEGDVRRAAADAEARCLVGHALAVPLAVHARVAVPQRLAVAG